VYHDDDAKGECFRKYKYVASSYQDHSLFLVTRVRYASLFQLDKDDYKGWAKGLKKAGYATDPKYPTKLISYIEKYKLYQYDDIVIKNKKPEVLFDKDDDVDESEKISQYVKPVVKVKEKKVEVPVVAKPKTVNVFPKVSNHKIHVVKEEDTLYSISKQYGLTIEEIQELNHLEGNTINIGQELRLSNNVVAKGYHLVLKKETLYSISKQYNTTVEALRELNNLSSNDISIGQQLRVE